MSRNLRTQVLLRQARKLFDARQYVLDSDWGEVQPRADAQNAYLESHSWDEYGDSGLFCPAFTLAAPMAPDPDYRRLSWRCLTCRGVQRGAVAESILVGQLDRWVYADESDDAAGARRLDGPGDARSWGGRVSALTRR